MRQNPLKSRFLSAFPVGAAERFNVDQLWFTQNSTPALQVIDGYRALSMEGEEPSDHTMRVSRMVLVEAP